MGNGNQPPSPEEFFAAYTHMLKEEKGKVDPEEEAVSDDELLRREALRDLDRSQMPAVASSEGGLLKKTIEHYTFVDEEDTAKFSVDFDRDLFPGASAFVTEENIHVRS